MDEEAELSLGSCLASFGCFQLILGGTGCGGLRSKGFLMRRKRGDVRGAAEEVVVGHDAVEVGVERLDCLARQVS